MMMTTTKLASHRLSGTPPALFFFFFSFLSDAFMDADECRRDVIMMDRHVDDHRVRLFVQLLSPAISIYEIVPKPQHVYGCATSFLRLRKKNTTTQFIDFLIIVFFSRISQTHEISRETNALYCYVNINCRVIANRFNNGIKSFKYVNPCFKVRRNEFGFIHDEPRGYANASRDPAIRRYQDYTESSINSARPFEISSI